MQLLNTFAIYIKAYRSRLMLYRMHMHDANTVSACVRLHVRADVPEWTCQRLHLERATTGTEKGTEVPFSYGALQLF